MEKTIKKILAEFVINKGDVINWGDLYNYFLINYGDDFEAEFRTFYDCVDEDMFSLGYWFDEDKLQYFRRVR